MAQPRKYSDEQMIDALHKTKGMVYLAADVVGCDADTIYNRSKVSPAVAQAMVTESEHAVDVAEIQLLKQINEGNIAALIFFLKTKGKGRGYVERHEIMITSDQTEVLKKHGLTPTMAWAALIDQLKEQEASPISQ